MKRLRLGLAATLLSGASSLLIALNVVAHHSETYDTITRVPPAMPPQAQTSGYCCMLYDIDSEGVPQNVSASYCSQGYYAAPSITALKKWRYAKTKKDGSPVMSKRITTYMSFYLADWDGNIIRDANGFPKNPKNATENSKSCDQYVG